MADLFDPPAQVGVLPAAGAAVGTARRGRPKGSKNKRAGDLAGFIVAQHEGRTPGQQLAAVALPTAKDRREARARARALGVDPETMAMVVKAEKLARAMGWAQPGLPVPAQALRDAWSIMFAAYKELLPYIHQRLAPKEADKPAAALPVIMMDAEPEGGALPPSAFGEGEENQDLIELIPVQLSQANSHAIEQTQEP
jgi:hypothetical protein